MTGVIHVSRRKLSAISLVISGILFVLYPAIRPFSDETSLEGATAFASIEWMVAHMLAMIAFTLIPVGLLGLYHSMEKTVTEKDSYWALVLGIIGVGFTLPFYGGETFGLHAIGEEALRQQNDNLVSLESMVRSGPGFFMFAIGLLLLAIVAILVAKAIWKSNIYSKWSGVPFAIGMVLYIPQFLMGQPLRVAHGAIVAIGCLWIGMELWKNRNKQ